MGFFDFLKSEPEPEPELTIENSSKKIRGRDFRPIDNNNDSRQLLKSDFELKNKQTTAGKGMNSLKNSGSLDPVDIEKIASNLQGFGAKKKDFIGELLDEIKKGNSIDYQSLTTKQKNEFIDRLQNIKRSQTTETDYIGNIKTDKIIPTYGFGEKKQEPTLTSEKQEPTITSTNNPFIEKGPILPSTNPFIEKGPILPSTNPFIEQGPLITSEHIQQDVAKMRQDELSAIHPDSTVDIEATETTFSTTTNDPYIERGKENSPDTGIFFSMLHVGTKLSYEYLKKSSGYEDLINIAEQFAPVDLKYVTNTAINTLHNTRIDDIGSLRASSSKRMKFNIEDKKHDVIHNPILYPFLVIALNFYMAKNEASYIQYKWMMSQGIQIILKSMGLDSRNIDYFTSIYNAFPSSLNTAFMRNANLIATVEENEQLQIKSFVELCIRDYNSIFNPNTFNKDLRKYEAGGQSLLSILQNLQNPKMLFEINQTFTTVDNFLSDVTENKDILIGLMGLIYAESRSKGDLVGPAMINNAMIDGIVYYNNPKKTKEKEKNEDLELMLEMSKTQSERNLQGYTIKFNNDKLAEFDKNGDTTILFRGSNFKEKDFLKKDFIQNILNFAGTREIFLNKEYNTRYQKSIDLIQAKQREIDNSGKGSLKIQGYSIGGIGAMYISTLFPDVPVKVYSPVISNTRLTEELINELIVRESNIEFFAIEEDPLSSNLEKYKNKLKIKYVKKNQFFNSHSLNNYKFI